MFLCTQVVDFRYDGTVGLGEPRESRRTKMLIWLKAVSYLVPKGLKVSSRD